jgi:hypothetical protein
MLDEPEAAHRMAKTARSRVLERFAVERMVAETLALYGIS